MRNRILLGLLGLVVIVFAAVFFWARTILASDAVRTALEAQLSSALGQPVSVGSIDAGIFPRITVNLRDVAIGNPPRIQTQALNIATGLRGLLSRRVEQATIRLDGARIELPLPAFALNTPSDQASSEPALEIVSIDAIELNDVELVSGGRTLRGDLAAQLEGDRLTLRSATLGAGETSIEIQGQLTDLAAPAGEFTVSAGVLNLDDLLAFASDFSSGLSDASGAAASNPPSPGATSPATPASAAAATVPASATPAAGGPAARAMNITVALEADRATLGALTIADLNGRAALTPDEVRLEPLAFGLFGGRYEGAISVALAGDAPAFHWTAALSGVDVGAATAFAGSPDTVTGTLGGTIDLTGRGADAASAIRTARGTARVEVADGIVKNLGLVRAVVIATSMRADAAPVSSASSDEPFSRMGATLAIAGGHASTDNLQFESQNLNLSAAGTIALDGSDIDLKGSVQLSDALSKEAGRDLVRYTQDQQGRVTLPVTISGSASAPSVRIDVADMTKRAIRNRAAEEAGNAIKKGLGGLIRR